VAELEQLHPETRAEWRAWLAAHHHDSPGVQLVQWRASTGRSQISYDDIVEEALCFGWIDSKANVLDEERAMITMTPRRPGGTWARTNKDRVDRLIADGLMTDAGLRLIEQAKADGSWTFLDDIEALIVPDDLDAALDRDPAARANFDAFPPSAKKQILYWIKTAKKPETRLRRIDETVTKAAENVRARS
jgi:uncharacterized protein YdeI (YjbR/CyaY-like superfamily)